MSCADCKNLDYLEDSDDDGNINFKNSGCICREDARFQNLKSFPFKKQMKCFEAKEQVKNV